MSEAVVDLPDPMSPPPVPVGNADELLSQLAAEQIDRMLSESEQASPAEPAGVADLPSAAGPIAASLEELPVAVPLSSAVTPQSADTTANHLAEISATADSQAEVLPVAADPSLLVRALEMINAPMSESPPWLRDFLGALAILTLINALGAILFVLFYRHH